MNRNYSKYNNYQTKANGYEDGYRAPKDICSDKPLTEQIPSYKEHAAVTQRSQAEIDKWFEQHNVTLKGDSIPRPIFEFHEAGFDEQIVNGLLKNYQRPTVIQSLSWPVVLAGRDLIGIAATGSGKTLGFALPIIIHIKNKPPRSFDDGPLALVLCPTRELANQVEVVAKNFCQIMGLSLTCLYGGAPKGPQRMDLQRGVDMIVATPGRLNDFLEEYATNLVRTEFLILDEADRMLDMGFEPQIRKIIAQIDSNHQTLMFSATWPKEVRRLASDFLNNPVFLNVGSLELSANRNIDQNVEVIEEHQKNQRLFQLLGYLMKQTDCKTMIFCQTKRKADDLTWLMRQDGWSAVCIHGDKAQKERDFVLAKFREGKIPILLATDVAARGLDVPDVRFVINYDYPSNSEDYVHRIGRTGRHNNKGTAYTFFTPSNARKAKDLINVMEEANQNIPPRLRELAQQKFGNDKYRGSQNRQSFGYDRSQGIGCGNNKFNRGFGARSFGERGGNNNRGFGGRGKAQRNDGKSSWNNFERQGGWSESNIVDNNCHSLENSKVGHGGWYEAKEGGFDEGHGNLNKEDRGFKRKSDSGYVYGGNSPKRGRQNHEGRGFGRGRGYTPKPSNRWGE